MSMLRIKSSNAELKTFPRFLQDYANYLTGIEAKSEKTVCEYLLDLRTFFRFPRRICTSFVEIRSQ